MKLVLTSSGLSTEEIVDGCAELVGKPKDETRVAVINEAYAVESGDHNWVLDDLNRVKANFGGGLELINLLALDIGKIKERIGLADVVFVAGGHPDYLMNVFNKTGFSRLLPRLLRDKVYVGSSAGSMVVCQRVSTEAYLQVYGATNDFGISEYLGLVDLAIKPHLEDGPLPNSSAKILLEASKDYEGLIYGLRDGSALIINGDEQHVIGYAPVKIKASKLVGA